MNVPWLYGDYRTAEHGLCLSLQVAIRARDKMKLSVIIVSYNVRHYLSQCLLSYNVPWMHRGRGHRVRQPLKRRVGGMACPAFSDVTFIAAQTTWGLPRPTTRPSDSRRASMCCCSTPTLCRRTGVARGHRLYGGTCTGGRIGRADAHRRRQRGHGVAAGHPHTHDGLLQDERTGQALPAEQDLWQILYELSAMGQARPHRGDQWGLLSLAPQGVGPCGTARRDLLQYGEDIDLSYRLLQQGGELVLAAQDPALQGESTRSRVSDTYTSLQGPCSSSSQALCPLSCSSPARAAGYLGIAACRSAR